MALLREEEIAAALARLPGWQQAGRGIRRIYEFASFGDAMRFVRRVADLADELDHHPEILIAFRTVTLTLWSHDRGGITRRDIRMATRIDTAG